MSSSTTRTIMAVLATIVALAAAATAQASTPKPAEMSKAEYRALILRSEALNQKYRLGEWKGIPQGMAPAEYRALVVRSEALNKQYGLGKYASGSTPATSASDGFAWGDFGIGVAATIGGVLLAAGALAGRRLPRTRTS
jgi:hypothetical protein